MKNFNLILLVTVLILSSCNNDNELTDPNQQTQKLILKPANPNHPVVQKLIKNGTD